MADSKTSSRVGSYRTVGPSWNARRIVGFTAASLIAFLLSLILLYRYVNPPISTLMARRILDGYEVSQTWVPLNKISRNLVTAVVLNEDQRFCTHWGVDWSAVEDALEKASEKGGHPRGASTIPMQLAKNLFLWPQRSYLRKAIEMPLAYTITALWPRDRVIEIYLNVAEWAPGVFGAEAAALHHFNKNAERISRREAALMAAALPNPFVRRAGRAGPKTRALARHIEKRLVEASPIVACIRR